MTSTSIYFDPQALLGGLSALLCAELLLGLALLLLWLQWRSAKRAYHKTLTALQELRQARDGEHAIHLRVNNDLESKQEELVALQAKFNAAQEELGQARAKLGSGAELATGLAGTTQQLEQQLADCRAKAIDAERTIAFQKSTIADLTNRLNDAKGSAVQATNLQNQVDQTKSSLGVAQQQLDQLNALHAENDLQKSALADLKHELAQARQHIERLMATQSESEQNKAKLAEFSLQLNEAKRNAQQIIILQTQADKDKATIAELNASLRQNQQQGDKLLALQAEVDKHKSKVIDLTTQLSQLQRETTQVDVLRTQTEADKTNIADLTMQLGALRKQFERLTADSEKDKTKLAELNVALTTARTDTRQLSTLRAQSEKDQKRIAELTAELESQIEQLRTLRAQWKEQQKRVETLDAELTDSRRRAAQWVALREQSQKDKSILTTIQKEFIVVKRQAAKFLKLQERFDQNRARLTELIAQLRTLTRDTKTLRSELKKKELAIIDLTTKMNRAKEKKALDLEIINGIGAVQARRLRDGGIKTLEQLAQSNEEKLRAIIKPSGFQKPDFESWIAQAKRLVSRQSTSTTTTTRTKQSGAAAAKAKTKTQAAAKKTTRAKKVVDLDVWQVADMDLEVIYGITSVYARQLREGNLPTLEDLAQADESKLRLIIKPSGADKPDFGSWIAQAKRIVSRKSVAALRGSRVIETVSTTLETQQATAEETSQSEESSKSES